ncbi:MAG: HlyD family efflux transporter periplasmic adaptor subunit [Verrucomicrobiales bacterium]|nr:HlyD family efflux transporter periplasmic adaptor subunit [Verrucomicrobiales bacterium]
MKSIESSSVSLASPVAGEVGVGEKSDRGGRFEHLLKHPLFLGGLVLAVAAAAFWMSRSEVAGRSGETVAEVVRADLEILVLEGGNVKALESLELKSQVESRDGAKILSIVDEGYEVTTEDVEEKKVLIRLDPTEMKERIESHDIEFENAQAALTEADEARAIQASESEKAIKEARQTARFALLDLEKYLGEAVSKKVLSKRDLPVDEATLLVYEDSYRERLMGKAKGSDELASTEEIINRGQRIRVDFGKILEDEELGDGEAQQELRKREDEWLVAQSESAVERETVMGSERLAEQKFITKATLDKQKVGLKKAEVAELSAETQLELYRRYEFPKRAEELLTKYEDSLHTLDRQKTEAIAKLTQAEAKFRNAEQMAKMAQKKRDELDEQLESCTIFATKPGLVVYGASERNPYSGGNESKIEEGASVRFKQTIITIPDMRRMGVKVSIRESHIKKVKIGQKVRITTDAEADKVLTGEVKKVAVLPDSNRWYDNPNQKIYPCEIHIDGTQDWLKPGMSAKVEIITDHLKDVLIIPLQAAMVDAGETITYLKKGGRPVRQVIETGGFNDEFIEVTLGLEEGDSVFLSKPDAEAGVSSSDGSDT